MGEARGSGTGSREPGTLEDRESGSWALGRYSGWCGFALLVAAAAFFYRDILFDGSVYVFRDMHAFILPMSHAGHILGEWGWPPLWNPLQSLGKPFAADIQNAVYYPPTWVLRGLPEPFGFNVNLAIHHVVAAVGMFQLLRRWRASFHACALGALLFSFGGLMVSFDNMANALQSTVWAPWAVLAFDVWLEGRSFAALAGLSAALGLTVLGAMPEVLIFENAALVVLAWDRRRATGNPGWLRAVGALLAANAIAFALCAAQLLPFLEYVQLSSRANGLKLETATLFSLAPVSLLAFVLPRRLVNAAGFFSETAAAWECGADHLPWAITLYLGVALVLVPFAWSMLPRARRSLWWAFVACFAALALGKHLPGYVWVLEQLPLLRALRYPEKFLVVVHFGLAVGAAFGLDRCLRDREGRVGLSIWAAVCAAGCVLAAALLYGGFGSGAGSAYATGVWARDLFVLAALTAILAVLAFAARRAPRATAAAVVLLVAFDLFRANRELLPTLPYQAFSATPRSLRIMERDASPLRIYSNPAGRKSVLIFPDSVIQEHELMLGELSTFHGIANLYGPASINLADHEELETLLESAGRERVARLLAAFGTSYLTSQLPLPYAGLRLVQTPRNPKEASVYHVENVEPRAYVAPEAVAFGDPASALRYLYESEDAARRVAVVTTALPAVLPATASGEVSIVSYLPDRVELVASMNTAGLVVLSDSFYPGWTATVNGDPTEIVRANVFARGVFVDAGEQRIVFRFAPMSHTLGVMVTIVSALVLLAGVVIEARRRR